MSHIETVNPKLSLKVAVDITNALTVHVDALLFYKPKVSITDIDDEIIAVL